MIANVKRAVDVEVEIAQSDFEVVLITQKKILVTSVTKIKLSNKVIKGQSTKQ